MRLSIALAASIAFSPAAQAQVVRDMTPQAIAEAIRFGMPHVFLVLAGHAHGAATI